MNYFTHTYLYLSLVLFSGQTSEGSFKRTFHNNEIEIRIDFADNYSFLFIEEIHIKFHDGIVKVKKRFI